MILDPMDARDFEAEALAHLTSVYRVALWFCGNPEQAEDLTQETYVRALAARDRFARTNMRGWLLTILRNLYLNAARRRSLVTEVPLEDSGDFPVEAIRDVPAGLVRRDIEAALNKLPQELRLLVLLVDVEELSMAEIAELLGWPVGTVKSRLWRARTMLSQLLSDYSGGMT